MKFSIQIALASLTFILMSLVSAPAFALRIASPHAHAQTYHDRTPRARTNESHARRS